MFEDISIPVFIINLKERTDRLDYVSKQFEGKSEFDVHVVEACEHKIGAIGLWQSMVKIIKQVYDGEDDIIIICEDDHTFTEYYNRDILIRNIIEAGEQGVQLLSGGIGGFGHAVPITSERYWIDWMWSTQFIVLYRPIFKKILDYDFKEKDTADGVFSQLTTNKMVIFPFISVQKDFGYSDVTQSNNDIRGKVTELFQESTKKMNFYYNGMKRFFLKKKIENE
jgi:hypothetical protein